MLLVLLVFKLSNAMLVFMKLVLLVTILGVRRVLPVPKQIPEQILGQQRVLLVPLVCILYLRTLLHVRSVPPLPTPPLSNAPLLPIKKSHSVTQDIMEILVIHLVKRVLPVPLQILEQVLGQQRVLLVPLARIPYLRTLLHVRSVTPLSTPTLSNARIRPIRKLQRAVKDITGPQVIHLVKGVMPATLQILEQTLGQPLVHLVLLAPSQILEQILGEQCVLLVPLVCILYLRLLLRVHFVPPLPTPPLSNAPLVPIKQLQPVTQDITGLPVMHLVKHVLPVTLQILEQVLGQQSVRVYQKTN